MNSTYNITLDQKVIGQAFIEESGMYYLINCEIDSKTPMPITIYLAGNENTIKLGGCYHAQNGFRLKTRLNKRMLQHASYKFVAQGSQAGIIVDKNRPVDYLEFLECAKIKKEGTYKSIYYG